MRYMHCAGGERLHVGIVGHAAEKFTHETEAKARAIIRELLAPEGMVLVSGHSPMGGIDIWAEEVADELGREALIYAPSVDNWSGFKERNLKIAQYSDVVHVVVVSEFPPDFQGKRYPYCYHCKTDKHIKSGGCWTALRAIERGKKAEWHVIGGDHE